MALIYYVDKNVYPSFSLAANIAQRRKLPYVFLGRTKLGWSFIDTSRKFYDKVFNGSRPREAFKSVVASLETVSVKSNIRTKQND